MADTVVVGGVTLDLDPQNYIMMGGRRRGSVHRLVDGGTVFQDRGFSTKDMVVQISGRTANPTIVKSLFALYLSSGEHTMTDWMGNSFTVIFTPGVESFQALPIPGSNIGYQYTMSFCVSAISKWYGVSVV